MTVTVVVRLGGAWHVWGRCAPCEAQAMVSAAREQFPGWLTRIVDETVDEGEGK